MGLFDSFFGNSQRRDLQQAKQQADNALAAGWSEGSGEVRNWTNQGLDYVQPYMQQGQQANALYGRFLGLNGADDQRAAMDQYQTGDPFRQQNEDMGNRALSRRFASMGMLDSGASRLAMARANLERGSQDYNNYLNRLGGASQQGFGAASTGAGLAANAGNTLGQMRMGYGQQQAGNAISYGNALAASRSAPWQNIMGLVGMGMQGYGLGTRK